MLSAMFCFCICVLGQKHVCTFKLNLIHICVTGFSEFSRGKLKFITLQYKSECRAANIHIWEPEIRKYLASQHYTRWYGRLHVISHIQSLNTVEHCTKLSQCAEILETNWLKVVRSSFLQHCSLQHCWPPLLLSLLTPRLAPETKELANQGQVSERGRHTKREREGDTMWYGSFKQLT